MCAKYVINCSKKGLFGGFFDKFLRINSKEASLTEDEIYFLLSKTDLSIKKMKSLNNKSPEYYKNVISKLLNVDIDNIKLFGSRINGGWTEYSDLDVAIKGKCTKEWEGKGFIINDIECELHWVDTLNVSWLKWDLL